jgi:hypothetical protein
VNAEDVRGTLRDYGYEDFWRVTSHGSVESARGPLPMTNCDYLAVRPAARERVVGAFLSRAPASASDAAGRQLLPNAHR